MMPEATEEVIDSDNRGMFNWNELWRYRELFYFFTWRDIKIKYKQTALGFLWAILQPMLMMVIFTLLPFGRQPSSIPYPVSVFSGLLIWNIFSSGLTNASNSMVTNAPIIKKIYFPRLIIPVSAILSAVFDFFMAFTLLFPLLIYYHQPVAWSALFIWPLAVIMVMIATLGIGCWLAALNVKYRDFRYVIPFLVQMLFFLTPIIYPVSLLKYPVLQYIIVASPVYAAVELFRFPLTNVMPDPTFMMISLASVLFFLIAGVLYFRRTEDFFADFA